MISIGVHVARPPAQSAAVICIATNALAIALPTFHYDNEYDADGYGDGRIGGLWYGGEGSRSWR